MSGVRVKVSGLSQGVLRLVEQTVARTEEQLVGSAEAAGRAALGYLKSESPKRYGAYRAGWRVRTERQADGGVTVTVYQAAKPGLTHLLEMGHAKWLFGVPTGERVAGIEHIAPAYERGREEMLP